MLSQDNLLEDKLLLSMDNFGDWIRVELKKRNWKQAELARQANVDTAVISNLINGKRGPGEDTCTAIAHAFHMPPETVFRAAGLLPNLTDPREVVSEVLGHKLQELSASQIEELIKYIEFMKDRDDQQGKRVSIQRHSKKTREGLTPPEVVKRI